MLKKIVIFTLFVLSLISPLKGHSQTEDVKTLHIAVIKTKDAFSYNETSTGFWKYFRGIKRTDIRIKVKEYNIKKEVKDKDKLIKDIKEKPYDLIVTFGRQAFESVKDEIKEIPIVFATMFNPYNGEGEPVEEDPNVMGIKMDIPISVQFETLRSFIPYLQNIGVIYSDTPQNKKIIEKARAEADEQKLNLLEYSVSNEKEIAAALDKLVIEADALWMIPDYTVYSQDILKHVILKTIEHEIPFMGLSKAYVKAGALFAIGWDFQDIGKQAAMISYNIINGEIPEDSKILPLKKYPIVINKRTAESIDLRIPQWISEKTVEFYD
jgi:putative ABC transport system substrate-binding protein